MRGNELLDKMELVDLAYVEAADRKPLRKRHGWIAWAAAAACLCLLLAAIPAFSQKPSTPQEGTTDYADLTPVELSTGMKQRLGLARVLASQAQLLLMDEPFASLDFLTRGELQSQLLRVQREMPRTIVLVTHKLEEALLLGQRILVMHPDSTVREFDLRDYAYPRDPDDARLQQLKKEITAECRKPSAE